MNKNIYNKIDSALMKIIKVYKKSKCAKLDITEKSKQLAKTEAMILGKICCFSFLKLFYIETIKSNPELRLILKDSRVRTRTRESSEDETDKLTYRSKSKVDRQC